MKNLIKSTSRILTLFLCGGGLYYTIEILWRGYSHWSMFILGGICFLLLGSLNEFFEWTLSFWKQCIIGACSITLLEFITGVLVNIILKLNVWDYSNIPGNILGQVCPLFTFFWLFLAALGIWLDDFLRWALFKEDFPHYNFKWNNG